MNTTDKEQIEEQDILEQMEDEIEEIQNEEGEIDEEKLEEAVSPSIDENSLLAKTMADFDNYKKRVERDKQDMIQFLKADILKVILPRIDDLERIIKNTPKELQSNGLYEGVESALTKLLSDLAKLGVKPFDSVGKTVDPDKHEVMTVVPGQEENKIIEEFEKGYLLNDKVLRHAKVIAGGGK